MGGGVRWEVWQYGRWGDVGGAAVWEVGGVAVWEVG